VFRHNPVLQRELILNLRKPRSFVLLLMYQMALAGLILVAYPRVDRIDLSVPSSDARRLADYFFLGQFALVSLMVPSFASGTIAGEKERKTYEMLLASPLKPFAIVIGKMFASLTHLFLMMVASLPIVFICLPLGGISIEEVLAAYVAILFAVIMFGAICVACSSLFKRVSSAMVVSYMIIAPFVLLGSLIWIAFADAGAVRLVFVSGVFPIFAIFATVVLTNWTARRLLYPQDVGSMGEEVVDLDKEQDNAVGLVIQRDRFPDRFFAPPRRNKLIEDGSNPVYDKELHAELFSQGTLMLRIVIQVSLFLAIPLMGAFLFIYPTYFRLYMDYVLIFNILATSVFAAGSITSERERQTLDLLLTTTLTGWQILSGKFISSFRVSYVLTLFLIWPVVLGTVMNHDLRKNVLSVLLCILIITVCAVVNSVIAIFCSSLFKRTMYAIIASFSCVIAAYLIPLVAYQVSDGTLGLDMISRDVKWIGVMSPFMAIHNVPTLFAFSDTRADDFIQTNLPFVIVYLVASFAFAMIASSLLAVAFRNRTWLTGR
jgi:ABC-type transport system involved in multi-copper enzyme maturation permease subunit